MDSGFKNHNHNEKRIQGSREVVGLEDEMKTEPARLGIATASSSRSQEQQALPSRERTPASYGGTQGTLLSIAIPYIYLM